MNCDFIQVFTTTDSKENAHQITSKLLDHQLAACVQLSDPIESSYIWKGEKEISKEFKLCIKTKKELFSKVRDLILKEHSYEVPEIIATPITHINESYEKWLLENTI